MLLNFIFFIVFFLGSEGWAPKGGAKRAPGLHTTAREPKRVHLNFSAFKTSPKFKEPQAIYCSDVALLVTQRVLLFGFLLPLIRRGAMPRRGWSTAPDGWVQFIRGPRPPSKELSWRPHRQVRTVGGRGRRSLRSSKTRKRLGRIRVGKHDGVADNAAPENGPLCDLKRAFSLSLNTGINVCSLWWRSTLEAALLPSCPPRTWLELIWKWRARTMQDTRGWLETHDTGQLFTSRIGSNQRRWSCTNSETLHECVCHIAVSVVEHAQ